jgi:hypothetical protein
MMRSLSHVPDQLIIQVTWSKLVYSVDIYRCVDMRDQTINSFRSIFERLDSDPLRAYPETPPLLLIGTFWFIPLPGKTKYLKEDLVEWVKTKITDPNETLEQAAERLYVVGKEEQREQQQQNQVFLPSPGTMDFYWLQLYIVRIHCDSITLKLSYFIGRVCTGVILKDWHY